LPTWEQRTWLVAIPLAVIVVAAFNPALHNGFVHWDDEKNFLENRFFRGLGAAQVKWAGTTFWVGVYQPLAWLLFEAQYTFWKLDARGYHLTSLILHAANAVVLYVLTVALLVRCPTDRFVKNPWARSLGAGLATALFVVHPLRVEAVAWASCQPYLPCALFSMLSVLAYLGAFRENSSPRKRWLVGSFVLFVAALLSKAVAVSLPAVLLILDVYPLRRLGDGPGRWFGPSARKALSEKVPFVLVSLVFMGLAIAAKPQSRLSIEHYDTSAGIAQACYGIWFYIVKTAVPVNLSAFYPVPREINWLAAPFLLSILATLGMSAGLFLRRRRWPGLLAVWVSYLVILAPNSGIIRISHQIAADRYSYMAMLGWVVLAAGCLCRLWHESSRGRPGAIGIIALCLGVLVGLVAMTSDQCRTWRDTDTLWTHALNHGADSSYVAHHNLASILVGQGKFREAAAHYAEALRLWPEYAAAHNGLGAVLYWQGKLDAAAAQYAEALRLNPSDDMAHNNLGLVRSRQGKLAAAATHFAEALRLNPAYADAHANLGVVLFRQGKLEEAATHHALALELNPGSADEHNNLGGVLLRQGKLEAAAAQYTETLRLNPGHEMAHNNLGLVRYRQGKFEEAAAHCAEALRLNPGYAEAYNKQAKIMAACPEAKYRNGKEAVESATHACGLTDWKNPSFLDTLAAAYAEAGDFDAAVTWQTRAIELMGDEREKDDYRSRLVLYQAKKPYREAIPTARPD